MMPVLRTMLGALKMSSRDRFSRREFANCAARCGTSMSPMVVSVEYSRSRPFLPGASLFESYSGTRSLGLDPGLNVVEEESESVDPLRSDAIASADL